MTVDVAVIGGGVSGLAAAYHLKRAGHRVVVLERQARAGGNAVSESIGGFLMEHGPSTVAGDSAAASELSNALGIDGDRCPLGAAIERRYLVKDGRLHAIPLGPMGFLLSDYLSLGGRLRMMAEPLIPRRRGSDRAPESIADFSRRRFGAEFSDRIMDPLVGGIYAGRSADLPIEGLFPKFVEFERRQGSVSRGLFAGVRQGKRAPASRLTSWRGGIGVLPRALAATLADELWTGVTVRRVRRRGHGFAIETVGHGTVTASSVVLATQPHVAAILLEDLDPVASEAVATIDAPPLAVVFMGYRREQVDHPLDSLGFLAASAEGLPVNGVQFCSTMFPGRAPASHVAIAAYVGGGRNPGLGARPAAELIDLVRGQLADFIGARGEPVTSRVRHWPRGIPQFDMGHLERTANLGDLQKRAPGVFLAGNFLEGPSVAVCLSVAAKVAAEVGSFISPAGLSQLSDSEPGPSRKLGR